MRQPWTDAPWQPRRWQVPGVEAVIAALRDGKRPVAWVATGAGKTVFTAELAYLAASGGVVIAVPTESLVEQTAATLRRRALGTGSVPGPLFSVGRYYGRAKEAGADVIVTCYPSLLSLAAQLAADGRSVHLLLADECHSTEAETLKAGIEAIQPRRLAGVTATAYRADKAESLELFDDVCFRYTYADGVRDGYLVDLQIERWHGDAVDIDTAIVQMMQATPRKDGRLWRGVVDADTIADAEAFAEELRALDIRAATVHSQLPKATVEARVEDLKEHRLDVIVHVNMLSEGVDLPWLRWYALRSRTGSRVRLVQRVGRVGRASEGKTVGLVLDPHGLCATIGLGHEVAIGEADEQAVSEEPPPETVVQWRKKPEKHKKLLYARAVADSEAWLSSARISLELAGLLRAPTVAQGAWRDLPATPRQVETLSRMRYFIRHIDNHEGRDLMRVLCERPTSRGLATDAIDVLRALAEGGREAREARVHWGFRLPDPPRARKVLRFAGMDADAGALQAGC